MTAVFKTWPPQGTISADGTWLMSFSSTGFLVYYVLNMGEPNNDSFSLKVGLLYDLQFGYVLTGTTLSVLCKILNTFTIKAIDLGVQMLYFFFYSVCLPMWHFCVLLYSEYFSVNVHLFAYTQQKQMNPPPPKKNSSNFCHWYGLYLLGRMQYS